MYVYMFIVGTTYLCEVHTRKLLILTWSVDETHIYVPSLSLIISTDVIKQK